jgi:hypothetical protein
MKLQTLRITILAIAALAALPAVLVAHHSIAAEFDTAKQVTISGIVTNVDWMNPHTYVFVDVKDATLGNKTRTWACELAGPNQLARSGFTRESVKVGMVVRVKGMRAKDGSFRIHTDLLSADNSVLYPK